MEPALNTMTRMPWGSWDTVEDQSEYVNQISIFINQSIPMYIDWLPNQNHFKFFADNFAL
jgi:hypothetical protein